MCAVSPRERLNYKHVQQGATYTERPVSFHRGPVYYYLMCVEEHSLITSGIRIVALRLILYAIVR